MAINIKQKDVSESAHAEAAAEIETTVGKTLTKAGEDKPVQDDFEHTSEPVNIMPPYERIEVGMSFKMQVASFTMLEFRITRSVPYQVPQVDPDQVFSDTHKWVEDKLNNLIAEQNNQAE